MAPYVLNILVAVENGSFASWIYDFTILAVVGILSSGFGRADLIIIETQLTSRYVSQFRPKNNRREQFSYGR